MKRMLPLLWLVSMLLTACGAAPATPASTNVPGSTGVALPPPRPTFVLPATYTPRPTPTAAFTDTPAVTDTAAPTAIPSPTVTPFPTGCQAAGSLLPPPDPKFPPVTAADFSIGPVDASVTFMEYADFQCPYCAQLDPILKKLLAAYPKDLRLVFRLYPLNIHDKALVSAQVAQAAGLQGKFWQMHDLLLTTQGDWAAMTPNDFLTWATTQAATLGLDAKKLAADAVSAEIVNQVQNDQILGDTIGIPGTPYVLANGLSIGGNVDEPTLTFVLDLIKKLDALEPKRVKDCPPLTIDKAKQYMATLNTSKGDVVIQLDPDKAPLAVNSFVFLARRGWFDGVPFHRVVADFVAQTGDPSGTGRGNPGYYFVNEINPDLKFDKAGVVGLANSGPNSNGSQFFITFGAQPHLDGSYTIFGQVTQGMDVVQKLTLIDASQSNGAPLPEPDKIIKVTIEVK
jgi:cyclophilin family peptidyl-prolyl cis-trans isomerase/protein-disulfide isomerase